MLLSDIHIKILQEWSAKQAKPLIFPYRAEQVQPASYDVLLGIDMLVPYGDEIIRVGRDTPTYYKYPLPDVLEPGQFVLCHTIEKVTFPSFLAGKFEGKSSLGRIGLMTHVTAGFIDPGFSGQLTLEVKNVGPSPLWLEPGIPIGQIAFQLLSMPSERPYGSRGLGSHYQDSRGVVGSKTSMSLLSDAVEGTRIT